ncbi:MAG: hypothetical protein LBS36_11295 [Oscillospiraceae bacterium]|nr:hypothetical protein [Oscillospiraceae bacterium]
MKKFSKILIIVVVIASLTMLFSNTVFALTEDEVKAKVAATSKEEVSGNVFIWFLCAMAFLKVSQKIDSFMSSLGINVGHTGGNMLAEVLIAARGISEGKRILGGGGLGGGKGGGSSGSSSGSGNARFLSGGFAGAVSRQFNKSAVSSATSQGGNVVTRNAFQTSMAKGGSFANSVIGTVAKGNIAETGSITGNTASQAMTSYLGYTGKADAPSFSDTEIGGGRIMGTEISADHPSGIQFGMYSADQYMAPEKGSYDTVSSADGAKWYRQYAADAVEKTPYTAPDGKIAYNEAIIQKLPPVPRRKDKV